MLKGVERLVDLGGVRQSAMTASCAGADRASRFASATSTP